ncbi:Nucleotide-binding universal stress protein, UspA family [Halogranum gelatinilyticum]|uniref:Nucleotide-binding universal stress protein, UspA family n=1 Tax=Halogranum gelatinilyticum TaxID=660521 RepID=A0A1G9X9N8_9EURY|nr:universal stress protein [Halogranum gelatinilyticum]SDM93454.1 Nucleotide-binding universal stress protein, UspA family [Halogranum gelatinilyticum]
MYTTILVPTDGSETASRAVDHAIDLAKQYGATVHALSVVDVSELGLRTPTEIDPARLRQPLRDRAQSAVDAVARVGKKAGIDVTKAIRVGVTHEVVTDYVIDNDIDLVVMGTHGRRGLPHAFLGSVTERVIRTSNVPILVVHPLDDSP